MLFASFPCSVCAFEGIQKQMGKEMQKSSVFNLSANRSLKLHVVLLLEYWLFVFMAFCFRLLLQAILSIDSVQFFLGY
jgi:hypothetical protein